jgi:hypothetical protein
MKTRKILPMRGHERRPLGHPARNQSHYTHCAIPALQTLIRPRNYHSSPIGLAWKRLILWYQKKKWLPDKFVSVVIRSANRNHFEIRTTYFKWRTMNCTEIPKNIAYYWTSRTALTGLRTALHLHQTIFNFRFTERLTARYEAISQLPEQALFFGTAFLRNLQLGTPNMRGKQVYMCMYEPRNMFNYFQQASKLAWWQTIRL